MQLNALNCPNCGGPYDPTKYTCKYCGSYVIMSNDKYIEFSNVDFDISKREDNKYPGIFVFGRLLGQGEKPIAMGAANYFTGPVSAGGRLLLTNKSLSFSAHAVNVGRQEAKLDLRSIRNVKVSTNLIISQHIIVETEKGSHRFVVFHGKEWVEKINEAISDVDTFIEESVTSISADYTVELRKLKRLLDDGIITKEEYDIKKRMILDI